MKLSICTLPLLILMAISLKCQISEDCTNTFFVPISKLIELDTNLTSSYKKANIENKKILLNKLCDALSEGKKILLIEKGLRGKNNFFGILYIFDNDKTYTYENSNEKIRIAEGNKFDTYGGLEKLLVSVKDSTIQRMEARVKSRIQMIDGTPTIVYFIDNNNNTNKLYIL